MRRGERRDARIARSRARRRRTFAATLALLSTAGCGVGGEPPAVPGARRPPVASTAPRPPDFEILNEYPHDRSAFTQGLFFHDGFLYEGTGRHGASSLRRVELETGRVLERVDLGPSYFGEGIALLNDRIYQLTWRAGQGFVYAADDFERLGGFRYEGEGWGLTTDGTHLIMSDGTATLRFLDPESFAVVRTLEVRGDQGPVSLLNELEFVEGMVLANVWQHPVILEISPETGAVSAEFDMSGLVAHEGARPFESVLNGIAYEPATRRLFVTGKLWSRIYEVELKRAGRS